MGKKVFITGGSRGIGAATVRHLAKEGYDVAFSYFQSEDKALALEAEIVQGGGRCFKVCGDFSQADSAREASLEALTLLKGLDCVVCNVGLSYMGLFQDMKPEDWHRVLDGNLSSVFYPLQALLPTLIQQQRGSIVTLSSMWGQVGASCEVAYSAAKSGVIGLTKALAQELAPSGVRVNCVAPGVIETDMIGMLSEEDKLCLIEETPLGRMGTGEDVAEVVAFLLGEKAKFLTGQVVAPNGGLVM